MRNYYVSVFISVQIATSAVSWMIYRTTNHLLGPTAVFFLSMEISALFGAMWANRMWANRMWANQLRASKQTYPTRAMN